MMANMEVDMEADMKVADKVADIAADIMADMAADKKRLTWSWTMDMVADKVTVVAETVVGNYLT